MVYVSNVGDVTIAGIAVLTDAYIGKLVSTSEVTDEDIVVGVYTTEKPDNPGYYVYDDSGFVNDTDNVTLEDGEVLYAGYNSDGNSLGWMWGPCGYIIEED